MFETPAWQSIQLAWQEADDADDTAARVERALDLRTDSRVLDVPCGTDDTAQRLADGDTASSGSTRSPRSLAWHATPASPRSARICDAVVRPRSFDAAICLWGSFGYFDDDGNVAQARLRPTPRLGRPLPDRHDRRRHPPPQVRALGHLGGRRRRRRGAPPLPRGHERSRPRGPSRETESEPSGPRSCVSTPWTS
jgi:hypothetical protein